MTNRIFDDLIAITFVSSMLGGLLYPAFVFMDFPVEFKVIVMGLYCFGLGNNCFIIAVSNDSFITNVSLWGSLRYTTCC